MIILAASQPNPAEVSNDHFAVIVTGIVAVLVALCTLAGIVIPLLLRARNDAGVARRQTENDHDSNLRDDLDGHGARIDWIIAAVTYLLDRDQTGGADARRHAELMKNRPQERHL